AVAKLGAESAHIYLDDVGIAVEVEIPYVLQDVALRQHLVGMAQQILEDREFTAGELDLPAAKPHPSRRRVKSQIARLEHGRPGARASAAQCPQPRDQHRIRER